MTGAAVVDSVATTSANLALTSSYARQSLARNAGRT